MRNVPTSSPPMVLLIDGIKRTYAPLRLTDSLTLCLILSEHDAGTCIETLLFDPGLAHGLQAARFCSCRSPSLCQGSFHRQLISFSDNLTEAERPRHRSTVLMTIF